MASDMAVGGYWIFWQPIDPKKRGMGDRLPSLQACIADAQKRVRRAGGGAYVVTRRDFGPYILLRRFGNMPPGAPRLVEGQSIDLQLKTIDGKPVELQQVEL